MLLGDVLSRLSDETFAALFPSSVRHRCIRAVRLWFTLEGCSVFRQVARASAICARVIVARS